MNLKQFVRDIRDVAHVLKHRVQIVRIIVDENGREIGRIHRGWFIAGAPPKTGEKP
jgi:hypothetical protein